MHPALNFGRDPTIISGYKSSTAVIDEKTTLKNAYPSERCSWEAAQNNTVRPAPFTCLYCAVLLHRAQNGSVTDKAKQYRNVPFPFCIANLPTEWICVDSAKTLQYVTIPVLHAHTVLHCDITHATDLSRSVRSNTVRHDSGTVSSHRPGFPYWPGHGSIRNQPEDYCIVEFSSLRLELVDFNSYC